MHLVHRLLVDAGTLASHFASVDPRLLALALVFHLGNHGLRSLAWRNVLAAAYPEQRVGLVPITAAYAAGVALNAIAPARGGDVVKVALARAAIPEASMVTVAATMPVLMVFDMLAGTALLLGLGLFGGLALTAHLPSPGAAAGWLGAHAPMAGAAAAAVSAAGFLLARRARGFLAGLWEQLRQGGAILAAPRCYLTRVALVQAASWACRIGVVMCLLAAFGLPASPAVAGVVMVVAGISTVVPLTPGGAGTQQVLLAYALGGVASAGAAVTFSIGMQAGITAVNALLGIAGTMVACRTLRPIAALRTSLRLARATAG